MVAQAPPASAADRVVDRLLVSTSRWHTIVVLTGLIAGLGISYAITYSLGGTRVFAGTLFFLVVMVAAVRFGYLGAGLTALSSMILVGPLMPLDVRTGAAQVPTMWISRGVTLFLVGLTTTALVERVKAGQGREFVLVEKERDLAIGKAAVVATVAHEFRSPLTVINGVARMLEHEQAIPEQFMPLFQGLMDSTDRLIDLVTTMGSVLDGRAGAAFLQTETLVTREVVAGALARVATGTAEGRVQLTVEPDAEFVQTDPELLDQSLRHVVENALKFSAADKPVEVRVSRADSFIEFSVRDRGPGIDPALLSSDPFKQGDQSSTREHEGLGLGLFASVRLAEMLGGSLTLAARKGGGSVVCIRVGSSFPTPLAP